MMLTTIPLISLYAKKDKCISCDGILHKVKGYFYNNWYNVDQLEWVRYNWEEYYDNVTKLINSDDGHIYDYQCSSCVSDREYGSRYNITHPQKEYML